MSFKKLTDSEYKKGYNEFLSRTNQKELTLKWFKNNLSKKSDKIENFLSIGCGTGEVDLSFFQDLPFLESYVGIEPNKEHIKAFQKIAKPSHINYEFHNLKFEELKIPFKEKFNLVIIGQSLYYPEEKKHFIDKAYRLVKEDGELLIFHTSGSKGINKLKETFGIKTFKYTSEELEKDLQSLELLYDREVIPSYIDIQNLDEAKHLVEFMLEKKCNDLEFKQACDYIIQQSDNNNFTHPLVVFRITPQIPNTEYVKNYADFRARTNTVEVISNWLSNFLQNLGPKNVLSVGCGNGNLDRSLLEIPTIQSYVGIEPNLVHLQECERTLSAKNPKNVEINFFNAEFFDYFSDETFDLILMSHVLYYIDARKGAITNAIDLLSKEGILLIFHQTEKGIYDLQKSFSANIYTYCTLEIKADLESLNIPYHYEELPSYIDLNNCSKELINFFLERYVSKKQEDEVVAFLNKNYPNNLMDHPVGVFAIEKRKVQEAISNYDLFLSEKDYAECFAEFITCSNQPEALVSWFKNEYLLQTSPVQSMLSIGCGTGEFDRQIIEQIPELERFTGLEPNPKHIEKLKKCLSSSALKPQIQIVPMKLESAIFSENFDLILFAHSLYYIKSKGNAIARAVELLTENGQIVIFSEPPTGGMHQINKKFGLLDRYTFNTTHLKQILRDRKIDFTSTTIEISVDIQNISDNLISFLLERKAKPSEIKQLRNYLAKSYVNRKSPQNTEAIIIPKPKTESRSTGLYTNK